MCEEDEGEGKGVGKEGGQGEDVHCLGNPFCSRVTCLV